MCGRFAQPRSSEDLARIFRARAAAQLPGGQFNVAPTDEVSAVVERDGERTVDAFRWGLIPYWASRSDARNAARRINARAETVERSPAYRVAFRKRRCLVPADAFYEWRRADRPARPAVPQPFAIERVDGAVMGLAGLWSVWRDPESAVRVFTVSIVTTLPNALLASIHNRMPVIVEPAEWELWLDEGTHLDELQPLLLPIPANRLRMRQVSPEVNDVRNEGEHLLALWPATPASHPLASA